MKNILKLTILLVSAHSLYGACSGLGSQDNALTIEHYKSLSFDDNVQKQLNNFCDFSFYQENLSPCDACLYVQQFAEDARQIEHNSQRWDRRFAMETRYGLPPVEEFKPYSKKEFEDRGGYKDCRKGWVIVRILKTKESNPFVFLFFKAPDNRTDCLYLNEKPFMKILESPELTAKDLDKNPNSSLSQFIKELRARILPEHKAALQEMLHS